MEVENKYLKLLMKIIDLNDPYKSGHSNKVAGLAELIGHDLGMNEQQLRKLKEGSLLHDLGKVMLPGDLWVTPQEIAEEEKDIIKQHPVAGSRLLEDCGFDREVVEIVRYHHEWWNGKGYPRQLKGEEIPVMAAVTAVAEAYISMITYDVYSEDMEKEDAVAQIKKQRGIQFSPDVVESFLAVI